MAASFIEAQPRGSAEFVESSVLEAVVPSSSKIDLENELSSWDGVLKDESGSILPFLLQRHVLLLDELLSVYVVFRTPLLENDILKSYLARLVVNIEAFAFSTAPPPENEPKTAPKEIIYSSTIKDSDEPTIIRHGERDDAYTYVIWKVDIFISRPQGRFHKPAVYFQPTASFKPAERPKKDALEDEYLPRRVPTALNLLQSFENDPALAGINPRLSAMRINKIAPSASIAREISRPIRNGQRSLFRVLPPLIWRMRYSRVHTSLSDLSLMASLDLEVAQFATYDVKINKVALTLHGGNVQTLTRDQDATAIHRPGDQLTYLYKIKPNLLSDGTPSLGSKGHFLTLIVEAQVTVSETCRPSIAIDWKTPVDFTNEQTSNLIRAGQRLSASTGSDPRAPNPDALPAHDTQSQQEQDALNNDINVTLTISGPPKVRIGEVFNWDVFIVNRSDKTRQLAVLVVSKRKRDLEKHKSHVSSSSASGRRAVTKDLLATAIVDDNVVYAKQKSARIETAELICLTTDIRLGQLSPGTCYTADLKFLALSAGVLSVESVRVIDLATHETVDIRDLPSVIAVGDED
ncbi:TRAPP trafficking subunit Trs65-domain-containing protein [Pyrenochaeta sp. MPI-SDFR-AT-0127]|nr:TRAPP trafficking subunit Trs65-domain-containing protein [Pyrenochaeta sp. MPI-SDFR-AT-0127]